MLLLNKFDNPLVGVRFDSGPVGVLINGGNKLSAGSYWSARTCTGPLSDNTIFTPDPTTGAAVSQLLGTAGAPGGTAPAYPPAPHCNTRGLTDLGKHGVERMMDLHMIVNPDHMSQAGVSDTLSLLEARHYSGVISPHGWMDPGNLPRLRKLGRLAFPRHARTGPAAPRRRLADAAAHRRPAPAAHARVELVHARRPQRRQDRRRGAHAGRDGRARRQHCARPPRRWRVGGRTPPRAALGRRRAAHAPQRLGLRRARRPGARGRRGDARARPPPARAARR